ncbi:hypothetical protein D6779_09570 [Candidatus Parcubacteria bacterium]|nr:MAG: hypothetical protein D6779_09570 [Candidatus Parcubacteria bacterium]
MPIDFDRYAYVKNSPMRYVDPTGHFTQEKIEKWFGLSYKELIEKYGKEWWDMMRAAKWGDVIVASTGENSYQFMFAHDEDDNLILWDYQADNGWLGDANIFDQVVGWEFYRLDYDTETYEYQFGNGDIGDLPDFDGRDLFKDPEIERGCIGYGEGFVNQCVDIVRDGDVRSAVEQFGYNVISLFDIPPIARELLFGATVYMAAREYVKSLRIVDVTYLGKPSDFSSIYFPYIAR